MSDARPTVAHRLTDVLTQENEALRRLDFPAAAALLTAKEAALAELQKAPAQTTQVAQRLTALATENQQLLERAIAVQTRVVHIIARAYKPPPAVTRYDGGGGRALPRRADALALSTRV